MSQLENNMAAATGWTLSDEEVSVTLHRCAFDCPALNFKQSLTLNVRKFT